MAIGMKHWLGIVAAGIALVTLWALPPRSEQMRRRSTPPEQRRYSDVLQEMRRVHGALQATRWSDSLSALTVRSAVDGLAVGAPDSHPVTPEGVAEWRALVEEAVESLERRDDRVVLGFFAQPARHAAIEDTPLFPWYDRVTFVGTREDRPYCIQVDVDRLEIINADLRSSARRGLGACRLYAMYGVAGSGIQGWLESGGLDFALGTGERGPAYIPTLFPVRAPMFGLNRYLLPDVPVSLQRCLSGHPDACEVALTTPDVTGFSGMRREYILENSPVTHLGRFRVALGPNSEYLLADLEAEFGAEAFARFWASEGDVPEAFEAAFGVELGSWLISWVEREFGLSRAGPLPTAGAVWLSLLTLMALAAWVSARATRRRLA